jgi:hypothetical protein
VIERVIANWLTNVNELGYTLPFAEVLVSEGSAIIRIARGGPGEHGKDIIARDRHGQLRTYQLKGGDINLKKWGEIRPQVEDLVRLGAFASGISKDEPHLPSLVTNGEVVGDAATSIEEYSARWAKDGAPKLDVIDGGRLLRRFIDAHDKYLPSAAMDFRRFVELYVGDFSGLIPRPALATFLEGTVAHETVGEKTRTQKRAIESMVLLGSYLVEGYSAAGNHVAAAMGWTTIAAVTMHVAQREGLTGKAYGDSLGLAWVGLDRALGRLEEEVLARPDFIERTDVVVEPTVYGLRALLVLGWLATAQLLASHRETTASSRAVLEVFRREVRHQRLWGEADWPYLMAISLFLGRTESQSVAELLVRNWLDVVLAQASKRDRSGFPSPYWLPEKVLALRGGFLARHEEERFGNTTYTAIAAANMLVRRMCRQTIAIRWPSMSRLAFADFSPRDEADWFLWSATTGDVEFEHPHWQRSWREWRAQAESCSSTTLPPVLQANIQWLLPLLLTYPHRANRAACAAADGVIGGFA